MAPLVVTNCALIRLVWASGGTPYAVNVLGARKKSPFAINQGIADSVSTAVMGAFNASSLKTAIGTAVTLERVYTRDINAPSQPEFVGSAAAVPGTATGNLLPPQVAICVTLRTALAGKEFRGRVYLPGFAASALVASGAYSPGLQGFCTAFVQAVNDALDPVNFDLAVISRKLSSSELVTTVLTRDTVFDTIRKRAIPGI